MAGIAARMFLQIVLMVFFGFVKGRGIGDFCYDGGVQKSGGIYLFYQFLRRLFLLFAGGENGGTVLCADIAALTVFGSRIMHFEKEYEQIAVGGLRGIKGDFNGFGVVGIANANVFVGRVFGVSARIANAGGDYARLFADEVLHAPEASARQYCFVLCHCVRVIVCFCYGKRDYFLDDFLVFIFYNYKN